MSPEPITIVGIEIRNFRRISVAHVRLDKKKGLVKVTGKNRAGKTSLLAAIKATLGGAKEVEGDGQTIHDEAEIQDEAFTSVLLSNGFTITRRYTPNTPKGALTIESVDGGRHGQSTLDKWLGRRAFDPLAFFDLDDKKRGELLLSLGQDAQLPEKLEALNARRKEAYEDRTPSIVGIRAAKAVPQPVGERPELVDVAEEMKRLQVLREEQRRIQAAERHVDAAEKALSEREARVEELEARLLTAREQVGECKEALADAVDAFDALPPDRTEAIEAVEAHIAGANEANAALEPWRIWEKAQAELKEDEAEVARLTAEIEAIDAAKAGLLTEAGIPVHGLSFDDDGNPLINGKPFTAASGAEKINMAVEVAVAANPQLRIALLDEANDLDLDALAELDRLATEKDFSIWAVRIGIEGPGDVHVEDGVASSVLQFE